MEDRLRAPYALQRREVDALLAALSPDVDLPERAKGGWVRGHEAVRDYWPRQGGDRPLGQPAPGSRSGPTEGSPCACTRSSATGGAVVADEEVTHAYASGSSHPVAGQMTIDPSAGSGRTMPKGAVPCPHSVRAAGHSGRLAVVEAHVVSYGVLGTAVIVAIAAGPV